MVVAAVASPFSYLVLIRYAQALLIANFEKVVHIDWIIGLSLFLTKLHHKLLMPITFFMSEKTIFTKAAIRYFQITSFIFTYSNLAYINWKV